MNKFCISMNALRILLTHFGKMDHFRVKSNIEDQTDSNAFCKNRHTKFLLHFINALVNQLLNMIMQNNKMLQVYTLDFNLNTAVSKCPPPILTKYQFRFDSTCTCLSRPLGGNRQPQCLSTITRSLWSVQKTPCCCITRCPPVV